MFSLLSLINGQRTDGDQIEKDRTEVPVRREPSGLDEHTVTQSIDKNVHAPTWLKQLDRKIIWIKFSTAYERKKHASKSLVKYFKWPIPPIKVFTTVSALTKILIRKSMWQELTSWTRLLQQHQSVMSDSSYSYSKNTVNIIASFQRPLSHVIANPF